MLVGVAVGVAVSGQGDSAAGSDSLARDTRQGGTVARRRGRVPPRVLALPPVLARVQRRVLGRGAGRGEARQSEVSLSGEEGAARAQHEAEARLEAVDRDSTPLELQWRRLVGIVEL